MTTEERSRDELEAENERLRVEVARLDGILNPRPPEPESEDPPKPVGFVLATKPYEQRIVSVALAVLRRSKPETDWRQIRSFEDFPEEGGEFEMAGAREIVDLALKITPNESFGTGEDGDPKLTLNEYRTVIQAMFKEIRVKPARDAAGKRVRMRPEDRVDIEIYDDVTQESSLQELERITSGAAP